ALLIEKGYEVVVFDNLSAGHRAAVHPNAAFVEGDLLNTAQIEALFASNARSGQPPFEGILHFASHIQVGESMRDPFKYFNDNFVGMLNLLRVATAQGVDRFILSSTANLFDAPNRIPIDETEPLIPGSVYGETKYLGERLLMWMERIYNLKF